MSGFDVVPDDQIIPYAVLLITIVISAMATPRTSLVAFAITTLVAIACGRVALLGALWLSLAGGSLYLFTSSRASTIRWLALAIFLSVGGGLFEHLLPGFNNLRLFDKFHVSAASSAFTMYLNFDRPAVGLLIYILLLKRNGPIDWGIVARTFAVLIALILPIALATGYVRFDPKLPARTWLWALNNLALVTLAEEGVFRGLIQGRLLGDIRWKWVGVTLAALAFGLDHYRGGWPYIAFATLAGLFYGYTYLKTRRLEAAMLVHFGLNLTHFLLFTYPSAG